MQTQYKYCAFICLFVLLVAHTCNAQTDIAGSIYGAFSTSPQGGGTSQTQSDAAGGLLEIQHIFLPAMSFEVTYSYNRADQSYIPTFSAVPANVCLPGPGCAATSPLIPTSFPANAQEFTADLIPSKTKGALRPFGVLGGGVLMVVPSGGQSYTYTVTEPVFVFGLGMDWARWKRVGLRFQYRGNLYSAPLLTTQYASTGSLMLTNEPMVGVYFRLP